MADYNEITSKPLNREITSTIKRGEISRPNGSIVVRTLQGDRLTITPEESPARPAVIVSRRRNSNMKIVRTLSVELPDQVSMLGGSD